MKTWIIRIALIGMAAQVAAHTGATGVVLERMEGMTAMADALKAAAPAIRGQADYDASAVLALAETLQREGGDHMVALFEEGTGAPPSEATPAVWDEPERFAALANDLSRLGAQLASVDEDREAARDMFGQIGRACSACHQDFRVKQN